MNYCFICGECCRTLFNGMTLTSAEIKLIEDGGGARLKVEEIGRDRFRAIQSCPFLRFESEKAFCEVYEVRPCQCRLYHCGRLHPNDEKLNFLSEIRKLMASNPEYRDFRVKMEDEAVEWGNRHGWSWRKMNGK